jgi:stress response protein YsnF
VVEKRLLLKEEVHLTRRRIETHTPQRVTLRREEAAVERINREGTEGNRHT